MKKIPMTVWVLAAIIGAIYIAWNIAYPHTTLRYRVTVTVETPKGMRIGSSVREASRSVEPSILPQQGGVFYNIIKGEAVVVDLDQRGILFALLGGQREAANVFRTLLSSGSKKRVILSSDQYPMFVRFRNLKDPKTIESVLELESNGGWGYRVKADHTEEMFGKGVKIKAVTIEMTKEPVTINEKYSPPPSEKGLYAVPHQLIGLDDFQRR